MPASLRCVSKYHAVFMTLRLREMLEHFSDTTATTSHRRPSGYRGTLSFAKLHWPSRRCNAVIITPTDNSCSARLLKMKMTRLRRARFGKRKRKKSFGVIIVYAVLWRDIKIAAPCWAGYLLIFPDIEGKHFWELPCSLIHLPCVYYYYK